MKILGLLSLCFVFAAALYGRFFHKDSTATKSDPVTDPVNTDHNHSEFTMRNDTTGLGHFGSSRGGRSHNGIDIVQDLNSFVMVPFNVVFVRHGITSNSKPLKLGVFTIVDHLELSGYELKVMYCDCSMLSIGQKVTAYNPIGTPDDLHQYYSAAMVQHLHIEIRNQNGDIIDPTKYFNLT